MHLGYNRGQDTLFISRSLQTLGVERDKRMGNCDRTRAGARNLQRGHLTLAWVFRVKSCFSRGEIVQIISEKGGGGVNKNIGEEKRKVGKRKEGKARRRTKMGREVGCRREREAAKGEVWRGRQLQAEGRVFPW